MRVGEGRGSPVKVGPEGRDSPVEMGKEGGELEEAYYPSGMNLKDLIEGFHLASFLTVLLITIPGHDHSLIARLLPKACNFWS